MEKENNNEMINQLEDFINEFNELNGAGIFEKEPMFTETLEKIYDLNNSESEETSKNKSKRKIGIVTDIHGLDVPLKVVLEDMRKRGITEIYSLGDNFEDGPNPKEVMRLLEEYNVISIAGNAEEYITLGTEPFNYLTTSRKENILWTAHQLTDSEKEKISKYPHSIELILGGKRIGLCHFATDVRTEFSGVWDYQDSIKRGSAYLQFSQTNSGNESEGKNNAYESREKEPLFNGKKVDLYDAIIQGHTHFKITEQSPHTKFYTLRANGMGYENDSTNTASYVILEETENGYDLEEVLVPFDRIKLAESIVSSSLPDKKKIIKFTSLTEDEIRLAMENLGFVTTGRK